MKAYSILDDRIMLRDHHGDLFEFKLVPEGSDLALRLIGVPSWEKSGVLPQYAETRIDIARVAAREIARSAMLHRHDSPAPHRHAPSRR